MTNREIADQTKAQLDLQKSILTFRQPYKQTENGKTEKERTQKRHLTQKLSRSRRGVVARPFWTYLAKKICGK